MVPSLPAACISATARPYRSHKFPACDFCHSRKSRCVRTRHDEPCSLCRARRRECLTSLGDRGGSLPARPAFRSSGRARASAESRGGVDASQASSLSPPHVTLGASSAHLEAQDVAFGLDGVEPEPAPSSIQNPPEKSSGHIVGPNLARDAQMLEQYITLRDGTAVGRVRPSPYSVYSDDPRDPVVYIKVPRQRSITTTGNGTTGFKQCEIIDNILGPHRIALLEL